MEQKKNILRSNSVFGALKWWSVNNNCKQTFGSAIAGQKLRESKWFSIDESRILCAVIECGFIVEAFEEQENLGWFGVAICKTSKGKSSVNFFVSVFERKSSNCRKHFRDKAFIVRTNHFN